jgi:hypothetical protein
VIVMRVAALALAVALAAACDPGPPQRASLEDLAFDPERFEGQEVWTTGTVREFGEEEGALVHHYVVEDAAQNRVELQPSERVAPFVGQRVTVTGRFQFDEAEGRVLTVTEIRPVPADA